MPDVSPDVNAMIEAMRESLDAQGVELTRDVLSAAALAAFTALTREGGVLGDPIDTEVRGAIAAFRGDSDAEPPDWPPVRWTNAAAHKLGEAALAVGLALNEDGHDKIQDDVYLDRFETQMIAVSAVCQEAVLSVRTARAKEAV